MIANLLSQQKEGSGGGKKREGEQVELPMNNSEGERLPYSKTRSRG